MNDKKKDFDCVEMKRHCQEEILKEVQGMTADEEFAYWQRIDREFLKKQKTTRDNNSSDQSNLAA